MGHAPQAQATPPRGGAADRGDGVTQLVVFRLDDREYALPVENVSEVFRMVSIVAVPEAPAWVPGVLNLRGQVIRTVDLRVRLGMSRSSASLNTPIIVTEADGCLLGLIADAVVELLTLPADAVEPPDALGAASDSVSAIARAGGRIILILDLARLCAESEAAVPGTALSA